jgi:hypothetical protein
MADFGVGHEAERFNGFSSRGETHSTLFSSPPTIEWRRFFAANLRSGNV